MRSPVVDGGGVCVGTAAAGAGGVGAATTGSDVDGSGAEADDSGEKSAKAATSDSSSTVTKIGWPTIILLLLPVLESSPLHHRPAPQNQW